MKQGAGLNTCFRQFHLPSSYESFMMDCNQQRSGPIDSLRQKLQRCFFSNDCWFAGSWESRIFALFAQGFPASTSQILLCSCSAIIHHCSANIHCIFYTKLIVSNSLTHNFEKDGTWAKRHQRSLVWVEYFARSFSFP